MDATEDSDLQLERASPNLLSDLAASLPKFLWLPKRQGLIGTSPPARRTVRDTTTGDLIKLVGLTASGSLTIYQLMIKLL